MYGFVACTTVPKGVTQTLYSAEWTLVGAANSVADLHDGGTLHGQDYENAKALILQAKAALDSAKAARTGGDTAGAAQYLKAAQALLNQLAAYLAAHHGGAQ
jgi:hypothetical protein